jgi:hypothetical protein
MVVSIHQPEHFPYLGFFQKMKESDLFIILDDVKFKKNNFQNRNRFLNSSGEEEWFTVPVEKKANSKLIKDVLVSEDFGWKKKLIKQMKLNFDYDFSNIYENEYIKDINMNSIRFCRKELDITTPMIYSSDLEADGSKSELLYNLCKEVGAVTYLSGQGGLDYLDMDIFNGMNLKVFEPKVDNYYTTLSYLRDKI